MAGQTIKIEGPDGEFSGYLASPAVGRGPAIVVIQEIFGINSDMREIADALAARGYFALAPDLFWRLQPGVQLSAKKPEEFQKAFELMGRFDKDKGLVDIQATIDHLRKMPDVTGKVGAVGYCLGGLLAYLTAARTNVDASVSFYGVNLHNMLGEVTAIKKPLLMHIAGKDKFVPPEAQAAILDGIKKNPLVTAHVYPGMEHAFARPHGEHFDQGCAELANTRTATFFRQHLS
jgi:carboxymethylenebutenolidase